MSMQVMKQFTCVALLGALAGCGPATAPCGAFTFTGSSIASGGINCQVSFAFNPATCGAAACQCAQIAYIQIVRIIDRDTGNYLQPFAEQANRMVTGNATVAYNGWAVDRLQGRVWGYYGRNNDGTFASTLTPGSNTAAAVLRDQPSGWAVNNWFDAVSVPVCIDAKSGCVNRLEGYEYWLFIVQQDGSGSDPFSEIGRQWHRDAFNLSVAEWNTDAPGLGKNTFPAMSPLP
jgi:hypothetical protein